MTETYNGAWNPVWGDGESKQTPTDAYHPTYPDTKGNYCPGYPSFANTPQVTTNEGSTSN